MIRIRHYTYKPAESDTYKVKYFRQEILPPGPDGKRKASKGKYWFQENTIHTDFENADRVGKHRVTELEAREHNRLMGVVEISAMPLADIAAEFIRQGQRKGGRRRNPWSDKHAANMATALAWWWTATGWKTLADINLAEAEDALDEKVDARNQEPIAGKTKNNLMSNLRAMLKLARKPVWADGARLAPKDWDPLENWEEYNDDPEKVFRDFELHEFRTLLTCSESPAEQVAYLVAAATGGRLSALKALGVFDADFQGSKVRLKRATNKSRKEVWKQVPRWIMAEVEKQARGRGPKEPLLLGLVGHQGAKTVQRRLRAGGVPIETAKGVLAFHSLKVTFVNLLLDQGTDLRTVQDMAEHSTADLSTRVYGRQRESIQRAVAEDAGSWLRSALPAPSNDRVTPTGGNANMSIQDVSEMVGAVGFEPATRSGPNIGKTEHLQAGLIPFPYQKGGIPPGPESEPLSTSEPGEESSWSHSSDADMAKIWGLLAPEARQSTLNHARGWLLGLLPNKYRQVAG